MSYTDVAALASSEEESFVLQTSKFSCWRQLFPAWHRLAELMFWACVPQQRAQHGRATRATTTSFCHPGLLSSPVLPGMKLLGSLWAPHRSQSLFLPQQGRCGHAAGLAAIPLHTRLSFQPVFPACFQTESGRAGAWLSSRQTLSCLD